MKTISILSLCCLLAGAPLAAQVSCTAALPVQPVASAGDCAGMSFDFYVQFTYSDGSTQNRSASGASAVMGVCAATYPACDISSTITPPQQLPAVKSFSTTFDSAGQRAAYQWAVTRPSILEQQSACPCADPSNPTDNPNGFTGFIPGHLADVTGADYVSC